VHELRLRAPRRLLRGTRAITTLMQIDDQGSVVLFIPEGDLEHEWLTLNAEAEPWQWLGRSLAVDARSAPPLCSALEGAGFVLERAR
jgi:hypothetical protein